MYSGTRGLDGPRAADASESPSTAAGTIAALGAGIIATALSGADGATGVRAGAGAGSIRQQPAFTDGDAFLWAQHGIASPEHAAAAAKPANAGLITHASTKTLISRSRVKWCCMILMVR